MIDLTDDDLQFLRQLAHTLRTQDTALSAKPVIYQVEDRRRQTPADPDNADGMCLVIESSTWFFDDEVVQAKEFLMGWDWTKADKTALAAVETLEQLVRFCDDFGVDDYHYTGYIDKNQYSGAFLTKDACERHIAANRHHYRNPQVFARSVWRNPELARLLTIIEKFAEGGA